MQPVPDPDAAGGVRPPSVAQADHSRFVQRIRRRYEAEATLLPPGLPGHQEMLALVQALQAPGAATGGRDLAAALRVARHLVLERLAVLDVEQGASLDDVTGAMSSLAELALELALAQAQAEADERHGEPLIESVVDADDSPGQTDGTTDGKIDGNAQRNAERKTHRRLDLWVVGMGKLGARELNVSSDIDLIYVYEEEGQTRGPRPVSFHEYFSFVAKRLYALIGETTDDGFVFRVDLALRPNGNSGPPVVSLAMLEEYFQVQGREWERFAWLKSRVVAPRSAVTSGQALALRDLVTPFVYRRYLDYGIFDSLRQLHRKIREEAQRRAAGRPDRANDVKLSRGGIREIEFIVQLMLVVRGGQFPEIRTRSTLRGLQRLVQRGLMKEATAEQLHQAYVFLRQVEHRIQYLDDQQTHLLPTVDADLAWIAASLGLHCEADTCRLLQRLCEVRELVAGEFDALLSEGQAAAGAEGGCRGRVCAPAATAIDSDSLLDSLPPALAERVRPWAQQPRVQALKDDRRLRLGRLMHRTGVALSEGRCTEVASLRFVDWVDPLLRRENYLALLLERPEVHLRLLSLLGLARWPMQYLMRHPGIIDELADERLLTQRFDADAFEQELRERLQGWQRSGEDDEEQLMDTLRHAHHAEIFRILVRDVEGRISTEQVADDLSSLADKVLALTLEWAWERLKQRHRADCGLGIIAYGKLGGKELGYGGDLDVVFVYDETPSDASPPDADDQAVYPIFVRKIITWLTLRTGAGELFDIDTALRPNGNSGLLVTGIGSFERYQVGRGTNTAWTWEHQALTRARFVAGPASVAQRFEATRRAVLTAERDLAALLQEVRSMREKVRAAHPVPAGRFDVKHSAGGMMDVEFAVQYLVLAHSAKHPTLAENAGNIALLRRAQAEGLLKQGVGDAAADAYRDLRRAQHQARLDEMATHFAPEQLAKPRQAVLVLWQAVFGTG